MACDKTQSTRHAFVEVGVVQPVEALGPSAAMVEENPVSGNVDWYAAWAVFNVRIELTAEDSFAAMRARKRLGMAIAAMIKMIATTISSSINEKPRCFRISVTV